MRGDPGQRLATHVAVGGPCVGTGVPVVLTRHHLRVTRLPLLQHKEYETSTSSPTTAPGLSLAAVATPVDLYIYI